MPLTAQPLADSPELDSIRQDLYQNVSPKERIGSVAVGAALIGLALWRRSSPKWLLGLAGAALIYRGKTGHCHLYQRLGINSRQLNTETGVPGNKGIKVSEEVTIARPAKDIYRFWRQLENLAQFMEHVESVEDLDDLRSRWTVRGPAGSQVEWTATILTDREGELISWESLPGSQVQNAGSVRFDPIDQQNTKVRVTLQYQPPGGVIGAIAAKIFGEAPEHQLQNDLQRLKEILENDTVAAGSDSGLKTAKR